MLMYKVCRSCTKSQLAINHNASWNGALVWYEYQQIKLTNHKLMMNKFPAKWHIVWTHILPGTQWKCKPAITAYSSGYLRKFS